jgi:uncharacterized membrane protein
MTAFVECFGLSSRRHCDWVHKIVENLNVSQGRSASPAANDCANIAHQMNQRITGGFCGACFCAAAGKPLLAGALLGGIGGVIGAFLGYTIRRRLDLHFKDTVVAICEDVIAVGVAFFLVSR